MLKRHWENTKCGGKLKTGVFTCDICNKQLTTERGLKKHRKLLHLKAKDKQCEMCSYSTYSNFNLRLHITKERIHSSLSIEHHLLPKLVFVLKYVQFLYKSVQSFVIFHQLFQPAEETF